MILYLQRFEFRHDYIEELRLLEVMNEVLDWREMVAHYPDAKQRMIEGSGHRISDFERYYLDEVLAFCGVGAQAAN